MNYQNYSSSLIKKDSIDKFIREVKDLTRQGAPNSKLLKKLSQEADKIKTNSPSCSITQEYLNLFKRYKS